MFKDAAAGLLPCLMLILILAACGISPNESVPVNSSSNIPKTETATLMTVTAIPSPRRTETPLTPAHTSTPAAAPTRTTGVTVQPTQTRPDDVLPAYHPPELIDCPQEGCLYSAVQLLDYPLPAEYAPYVDKTYRYGSTQNGARESHSGVEIPAGYGTPVIAPADGRVYYAGNDDSTKYGRYLYFYGNLVILEHHFSGLDETVYTVYAHLSEISIEAGDTVTAGQQIGLVGNSGAASGPHLHFEVRTGKPDVLNTINPELWLKPARIEKDDRSQTGGTLVIRMANGNRDVYSARVLIQDYSDPQAEIKSGIDAESYAYDVPRDEFWNENLVVGSLYPGTYRVTVTFDNRAKSRLIEIESEHITLVEFNFAD